MRKILALGLLGALSTPALATTVVDGLDLGPLAPLIGIWKSDATGGVDLAPGQVDSDVGAGGISVSPYHEVMTFEVAADATNASSQYLTAVYYKQEVFRKSDGSKFHDQRGYFIYDKENNVVYNSFCVPRATCVTAQGEAGSTMTLKVAPRGVAESSFMMESASTVDYTMNLTIASDKLTYSQTTSLDIYGKPFVHTDSGSLIRVSES